MLIGMTSIVMVVIMVTVLECVKGFLARVEDKEVYIYIYMYILCLHIILCIAQSQCCIDTQCPSRQLGNVAWQRDFGARCATRLS